MVKQLLERVALGLESRAVPYMIIGGQAVLVYGEPRLTQGVDVTLGVGPEQLAKIQDLAPASGWEVLADRPPDFVQRTLVLPCLDPQSGIRLDFIFSFSDYESQAIEHALQVQVGQALVRFASPEDLVIHKMGQDGRGTSRTFAESCSRIPESICLTSNVGCATSTGVSGEG